MINPKHEEEEEEEKSLGHKRKRSDAQRIPDDIIHEILVRVPTALLLKLRVVCKSWNSQVKTSAFILNNLKSNNKNDDLLIVYSRGNTTGQDWLRFLDFINVKSGYSKTCVSPIYDFKRALTSVGVSFNPILEIFLIGTCNGLVLIKQGPLLVLWNPCVRKFATLPRPTVISNYSFYYLGYDSVNNDHKVVQVVLRPPNYNLNQRESCIIHVFSLLTGSWKNLNPPADFLPNHHCVKMSVVVNGALHWISSTPNGMDILTFNLSSEVFGKFKVPESVRKYLLLDCLLHHCVKYRECFALMSSQTWLHKSTYDLWVMKEYGSPGSWTKLTILKRHWLQYYPLEPPLCFVSGRVLQGTSNGIVSTDSEGNQPKVIFRDNSYIFFMDHFVESLVLLDRSDACSY